MAAPDCHLQALSINFVWFLRLAPLSATSIRNTCDFLLSGSLQGPNGGGFFWEISPCLLSLYGERFSLVFSLSFNDRQLLSRSRHLSFPSCRCPSEDSSLCPQRTPASAPTVASQTASMARLCAAGHRRWTNTGTRCTSATILTRRYQPLRAELLHLCCGVWFSMVDLVYTDYFPLSLWYFVCTLVLQHE